MTLSLPPELEKRVESEIASSGDFQTSNQLIEEAIIRFLDARGAHRRRESLDRLTDAVIEAGLYDKVYLPSDKDE